MNKLFGYRKVKLKSKSFIKINILILSIVIYYKYKYGVKLGIGVHNIFFEFSITNWKYSPIAEAFEAFTEKD